MSAQLFHWFGGGGGRYPDLYHFMRGDALGVAVTVTLDLMIVGGCLLIAKRGRANQRSSEDSRAEAGPTNLRNAFLVCAVCGYAFVAIQSGWPAWRLYHLAVVASAVFALRYAWNARDLRVLYRELQRSERLAREVARTRADLQREVLAVGELEEKVKERTAELNRVNESLLSEAAERQRMTDALRASEEFYRAHFELAVWGLVQVDVETRRFVRVNRAFCEITGYAPEELLQLTFLDITHPDDHGANAAQFQSMTRDRCDRAIEKRYVHRDGHIVWVRMHATVICDSAGRPLRAIAVIEDISVRKRADEALRASEALNTQVVESSPDCVQILNLEGGVLSMNVTGRRLMEVEDADALTGAKWVESWRGADREAAEAAIDAGRSGATTRFQGLCTTAKGRDKWWDVVVTPMIRDGVPERLLCVARDVTYRRWIEEELRSAKESAEAANKAKSRFLATMSHEIRTPMTAVLGYAELLIDTPHLAPETRAAWLASIYDGCHKLLCVINDILDISKIESDRITIVRQPCDARQLLGELENLLGPQIRRRGLGLTVECSADIPTYVYSDPGRFRQILLNLIGNAVKFTERGGIAIYARKLVAPGGQQVLCVEVKDTGVGIAAADLGRIFDPFVQAGDPADQPFGGTGLGLSISKYLARLLGGDISVVSSPGAGSTFTLTIDAPAVVGPMLPVSPATGRTGRPAPSPVVGAESAARLLVVDDVGPVRELVAAKMRAIGLAVAMCDRGDAAVAGALEAWRAGMAYDVVLMDMAMPGMNGYAATRMLRDAGYPGAIIAFTANAMAGTREQCLAAGCDDFVSKPADLRALVAVVERFIDRPAAMDTAA